MNREDLELDIDNKNIKLNSTDIEVLEKKVSFFPSELLKEPTRTKISNTSSVNTPFNTMRPQVNQETLHNITKQNVAIKPIFQMRSNTLRGIGMKMF